MAETLTEARLAIGELHALLRDQQTLLTRAMAQLDAVSRQRDHAIAVAEHLVDIARASTEAPRFPQTP